MAKSKIDELLKQNIEEEREDCKVETENYYETTINDYDKFDAEAWAQGSGYSCPGFPLFDSYMEGLTSGLYMFAGESNHGKTAMMTALLMDYCKNPDNKLFGIYFSLDDTRKEVIPRLIAAHEFIPISVAAKPNRYRELINNNDSESSTWEEFLSKREDGLAYLKSLNKNFKVVDGTTITCGEQILDYCRKLQAYVKSYDPDNNIIVGIDSLSDIAFNSKNFKSDKELNDYIAKQVKKWAVEILDVPIFGSLHLRKIEQNRRPTIADVKESGRYAYEASALFLVHNDVSRNKQASPICHLLDGSDEHLPIIELDWAKNKKSSYKGKTYHNFYPNYSLVTECSLEEADRFNHLIYSN